jgi:hypothetical protein
LCRVFIRPVYPILSTVILQNIRRCDSSLFFYVLNCGKYSVVAVNLELWLNDFGGVCTFLSSSLHLQAIISRDLSE